MYPLVRLKDKSDGFFDDKTNLVTGVCISENYGVIVSFFSGYFRMFEPIRFKEMWVQDCYEDVMNESVTITACALSEKLSYYAIGGVDGKIIMYDIVSKSKLSSNSDVHHKEICKIDFFDQQC